MLSSKLFKLSSIRCIALRYTYIMTDRSLRMVTSCECCFNETIGTARLYVTTLHLHETWTLAPAVPRFIKTANREYGSFSLIRCNVMYIRYQKEDTSKHRWRIMM